MSDVPEVVQRIEVGLVDLGAEALAKLQKRSGLNLADIVNRALQVHAFLDEEIRAGNGIFVRRPDGLSQLVEIW